MRDGVFFVGTGPRPTVRDGVFFRSAGACPPRALECARHGEGQALALRCGGGVFFRSAGACPPRALDCADVIKTEGLSYGIASRPGGLSYWGGIETGMHNLQIVRYYAIIVAIENYLRGGYEKCQNPF